MLDMHNKLSFPRLQYVKKSVLIKKRYENVSPHTNKDQWEEIGEEAKPVSLFKLDWSNHRTRYLKDDLALPKEWGKHFDDLLFVLNKSYLNEIHRQSEMAFTEWARSRSFDTMIRDVCLEPVTAHIWVAFRLICDCIFDDERKYYREHDWVRNLSANALVYRFWHGQTGDGLLWYKSKMDKVEEFVNMSKASSCMGEAVRSKTISFLHYLKEHEKKRMDKHAKKCAIQE